MESKISVTAEKITKNRVFQASLMILGLVFTVSMIIHNYNFIKLNRIRLKEEEAKLKEREPQTNSKQ